MFQSKIRVYVRLKHFNWNLGFLILLNLGEIREHLCIPHVATNLYVYSIAANGARIIDRELENVPPAAGLFFSFSGQFLARLVELKLRTGFKWLWE